MLRMAAWCDPDRYGGRSRSQRLSQPEQRRGIKARRWPHIHEPGTPLAYAMAMATPPPSPEAVHRLAGLFIEMPGTQLTPTEAQRLSGLDLATCDSVLRTLHEAGFLHRKLGGVFVRAESY
jgi:hypothetical protein